MMRYIDRTRKERPPVDTVRNTARDEMRNDQLGAESGPGKNAAFDVNVRVARR